MEADTGFRFNWNAEVSAKNGWIFLTLRRMQPLLSVQIFSLFYIAVTWVVTAVNITAVRWNQTNI
ncbi:hypothetical protein C2I18_09870 [Paenibacillus sp. PK3_47]|nr:hypothetical protein C2I18_09870 [Paenibacillus sp. PK3_47]